MRIGYARVSTDDQNLDLQVAALFVTVDPERDTPDMLKTYLRATIADGIGHSAEVRLASARATAAS